MAMFKRRTVGKPGEWYYCVRHQRVEEGPECRAADRLGPYPTREEAGHAMETARERNVEWETDPRWHEPGREPGRGPGPAGDGSA